MRALAFLPLALLAAPAMAQDHDHSQVDHSAHQPAPAPAPAPMDHSQMDHSQMDHSAMGHAMPAPAAAVIPAAPAPARAAEGPVHAADAIWGAEAMAPSREVLVREMGGAMQTGVIRIDRLEARLGSGDGYLWDAEGMFGGDIDKLVIKSAGEGAFDGEVEQASVQALWGHAIGPWFDLQAGVRLDVEPATRAHATLGLEGLLPYMIHFDGAAFLSDRGDVTADFEMTHDMRLNQRLVLQPRVEAQFSAQDVPAIDLGTGLTKVEAGLRLRYEIVREFAPYVGVEQEQLVGSTRRMARAAGDDPSRTLLVLGVKAWF